MALKIDENGRCERWNDLWCHSYFYDEKCDGCKFIVIIAKHKFCGKTHGRVTLHQTIRDQIGCTWCKYYEKKLDSAVCIKCLEDHPNLKPFGLERIKYEEAKGTKT